MTTASQSPVINQNIETHIALERINTLFDDSYVVAFSALVVTIITGALLWSSQPHLIVTLWICAHIVVAIIRGPILRYYFKQKINHLPDAKRWAQWYAISALLSGCLWGSLPWLMIDFSSTYNVSAIVIIMFGMIAASNVSLSIYPTAFFCYALPTIGLLFFRLILEGGDFIYVSALLVWYLIFNIGHGLRTFRATTESIRQRFENIELMKDLEVKKKEADKANLDKSRFLAATSHDLRQPLHALDLYLGALEVNLNNDLQKDLMLKTKKSSQSVNELLNALLDISRLDAGEVQVNLQNIALTTLLLDIQSEWAPQLEEAGRKLRIFPSHASIQTDRVLFSRMLGNIIANAVRHTSGDVLIGTRRRNGLLRFEIWDQGKGIPAAALDLVFTEYFQLNNPERDRTKGLGLGLATVKRLSLLLNHPAHIQSYPGKGLRFSIDVPIVVSHDSLPFIEVDFQLSLAGNFILVIDDEEAIRDSLQILLGAWGCEVLVAESGKDAIEEMRRDNYPAPDIIVSDYRLHDNQVGIEAAEEVMSFFEQRIPTLIVTGDKDFTITTRCESMGCTLLYKPLSSNKLQAALNKLLNAPAQE